VTGMKGRGFWPGATRIAVALALSSASAPAASAGFPHENLFKPHKKVATRRIELGDWELRVSRNLFSGEVACRLNSRDNRVTYQGQALGFRFSKTVNTASAAYRIDGGSPRFWRDDLPALTRLATPIDGPGLDNATGGIVWIPASALSSANRVAIQPRPERRVRDFHLRGFAGLLTIARQRGCNPEARFVP
jgi:hypothetical protein